MEFAVHSGDRSPAAVAQAILRESIDKPGSWYAVASYLLTQFSYVSRSPERNTVSEFKTLGGTGRLGVGFKPPEKPWGGFAIVDMGGFTLDGRNYTFASTEAHATYNFPLQVSVAQASAGLYTKTLPSLTVASVQNPSNLELSSVASRGMHFGGRFWHPFSTHWGAAAHAQLYLPVAGSTPNGQPIESMPSFEIGLKGTFRLSAHSIGFAGYTFREDTARYRALDDRFDANQINLSGHYLNFILEYAFD
jgi:hypothetical protein